MKTITLEIPENITLSAEELQIFLASKLYEAGNCSLGQAAKMAHLDKRSFIEVLGKYGVSVFNYPTEDLSKDVTNA